MLRTVVCDVVSEARLWCPRRDRIQRTALSAALSRIEGFANWSSVGPGKLKQLFPDGLSNEFRKLYFEVAQAFSKVNIDALTALVPSSHILYGSDYPVFPADNTATGLAKLDLPANLRRAIDRDNLVALLPKWKA